MPVSDDLRVSMWRQVLELSSVSSDENVVILTGESSHPLNIDGAFRAAVQLGARACRIEVPAVASGGMAPGQRASVQVTPVTGQPLVVEMLKQADMVVDLVGLLHSPEQTAVLDANTRMLMVVEPPEMLARMIPTANDKRRVLDADRRLRAAKEMHVTSKAGTDFRAKLGQFPTLPEYGFADEPGHWDHWPSAFISTWPTEGTAQGRIVVDAGDMLFPFKSIVQSPIILDIKDGFITRIEGGFEAKFLRRHMETFKDPDVYAVSHIGWGLQSKAVWSNMYGRDKAQSHGMDARAAYGNFMFSTGPNSEAGGSNHSACHIDIPMADCSVSLDGVPMTLDGDVVVPEQKVA